MKLLSVGDLENKTRLLELQIRKLDRRGAHMTPPEHLRSVELKKQRLAMKDRLIELRRTG
jgi:hypothetical protein